MRCAHAFSIATCSEMSPWLQYTSFRTGGCAACVGGTAECGSAQNALFVVHEYGIPYEVIGNGTNLLVSDAGIDAVVFRIGEAMGAIWQENGLFFAEAGASFARLQSARWSAVLWGWSGPRGSQAALAARLQ